MRNKIALLFLIWVLIIGFNGSKVFGQDIRNVILVSWDGAQGNHLDELMNKDQLSNLKQLIFEGTFTEIYIAPFIKVAPSDTLTFTNLSQMEPTDTIIYERADTDSGHARMLTGQWSYITGILTEVDNELIDYVGTNNFETVEDGLTIMEIIKQEKPEFFVGSVAARYSDIREYKNLYAKMIGYFKGWDDSEIFIPYNKAGHGFYSTTFSNAEYDLDFFFDSKKIPENLLESHVQHCYLPSLGYNNKQGPYELTLLAELKDDFVAQKAIEFIKSIAPNQFFIFIHFCEPDLFGHIYGEENNDPNYDQYSKAIISNDIALGIIIEELKKIPGFNSSTLYDETLIIVTTDHGATEDAPASTFIYNAEGKKILDTTGPLHGDITVDNHLIWMVNNKYNNLPSLMLQTEIVPFILEILDIPSPHPSNISFSIASAVSNTAPSTNFLQRSLSLSSESNEPLASSSPIFSTLSNSPDHSIDIKGIYQWEKTFGESKMDWGYSVQQTTDGGFIIVGSTDSFGAGRYDVYLIKTNSNGKKKWSKTFGGNNWDLGYSVQQTTDGGYIIVGETSSFGAGWYDVYLIKTDPNGNESWSKTFGGRDWDWGHSVQQTIDGGFIIIGSTQSFGTANNDVYLIKTDSEGNEIWSKTFGGNNKDLGYSVQQTTDSGYIIIGGIDFFEEGLSDVYLIKTDPNGNESWNKIFGGSGYDRGRSVQQTTDGGYIICGYTGSFGMGKYDVYLIKTDAEGNEIWAKTFGGNDYDYGYIVQQTTDNGFIIAGKTYSFDIGGGDVYLIMADANGNEVWSRTFGGLELDYGYSLQSTIDGGYIIAGETWSFGSGECDVFLIKTDGLGPVPDIMANGLDIPIIITPGDNLSITIALDQGNSLGKNVDFWLLIFYYNPNIGSWIPIVESNFFQSPLFNFPQIEIFNGNLPIGQFLFFFGVDMVMDGVFELDQFYYDYIPIMVRKIKT